MEQQTNPELTQLQKDVAKSMLRMVLIKSALFISIAVAARYARKHLES